MMYVRWLPIVVLVGVPLMLGAGTLRYPQAWLYVAALWFCASTVQTLLAHEHPGLLKERLQPPSDRDRASRLLALPTLLGHWLTAGLDAGRFGWSHVPLALQFVALSLLVASLALVGWTQLSNPFASSAVRIQAERHHAVASGGPYAWVRHPMYLGVLGFALGSGPALGSWLASLWLIPLLAMFVRRTLLEDRMLHLELPGYVDYASRVRWRVVPGVF